jgi:hypothetical protein
MLHAGIIMKKKKREQEKIRLKQEERRNVKSNRKVKR